MENNEAKWKTPLMVVLGVITAAAIIYGILTHFVPGIHIGNANKNATGTITIDGKIESIDLNIDIGDIKIEYSDKAELNYDCYEKLIPKVTNNGGVLSIHSPKNVHLNSLKNANGSEFSYVLVLPKGTKLKNINMDLDCGNLEFSNIVADSINIDSDLGNVELSNLECKSFTVDADLGNVEITDSTLGKVKVNADLGNVEFKKVKFDDGDFNADMGSIFVSGDFPVIVGKCDMGAIEVETDREEKDVLLDLKANMGSVTVNGRSR